MNADGHMRLSRGKRLLIGLLGGLLIVVPGAFVLSPFSWQLTIAAANVAVRCAPLGDTDEKAECYRVRLSNLFPEFSVSDIFSVIAFGQPYDPALVDCHFIAHRIGEIAVAANPTRWPELIKDESGTALCSFGFVHGVTIAAYNHDGLSDEEAQKEIPKFQEACDVDGRNLRDSCLHAMGHMMYYITGGDVARSLAYCDQAVTLRENEGKVFSANRRCYTGAMMMLFFSFIDPDWEETTRYVLTRDTVRSFCESLKKDAYVGACLRASWPLFDDVVTAPGGVDTFCQNQPDAAETEWCYAKIFVALAWKNINNPARMAQLCEASSASRREACYLNATHEYLAEGGGKPAVQKAVALCGLSAEEAVRQKCLNSIVQAGGRYESKDSPGRSEYCIHLPRALHGACLDQENQ
ncbi:MAG: hypothetical protein KBE09_02270 [Candidatus Pacebacteria bacterium]|nr:hypothetical protein [Candidatus Paceibacterota bacterium]